MQNRDQNHSLSVSVLRQRDYRDTDASTFVLSVAELFFGE